MGSTVLVERRDSGIQLIGIDRPEANNRIDPPTYAALGQALYELEHDDELRVGCCMRRVPTSYRPWTSPPMVRRQRQAPFPRPARGPTSWIRWT